MNPALIILVVLVLIFLIFLLAFAYRSIGRLFCKIWENAASKIKDEDINKK